MILLKKLYNVVSSQDDSFVKVKLKPMLSEFTFNMIIRMVAGKQYNIGEEVTGKLEGKRLQKLVEDLFQAGVSGNIGDFFPSLQWIDFQGFKKNTVRLFKETDAFLQDLNDEHRMNKGDFEREDTMISHFLSLQESQPEYYTDENIKAQMMDMLNASIDTIVSTIEWSMSNLLNNPNALEKTIAEVDCLVGQDKLLDEVHDLRKLNYLQNVISETLRLHTIAPLLIPHRSSDNCTLGGYHIPKDTMLFVNAWAIHRDPKLWDEPTSFRPDRFGNGEIDHETNYKLMPFGMGRRSCPGMDLARRTVGLVLGLLIQCFEWKRVGEKEIDMTEGKGVTMPKAEPLEALCKAGDMANKLLS
ncbi:cytochrome P450 81E8-like [Durio zibethinus]|uniref:Cytochrome P450 81E8-like n=1 Tax=Durio zibethinus TaxID=66656 RepID=A0A6P5WPW0_DURZI|nr:cytochrome P450 81E8-like [Durio zibethinus]